MVDYRQVFGFLNKIIQEKSMNLEEFEKFCKILEISDGIEDFAKDLIFYQRERFEQLKKHHRKKLLIYIAAIFVSYIIVKKDYTEFEQKIETILYNFKKSKENVVIYKNLNQVLVAIQNNGYHQYLITPSLTIEQIEAFSKNIYKIEYQKFLKKLQEKTLISNYVKNLDELIEIILYIIKVSNEDFSKIRKSRYGAALYFILSRLKKFKRVGLEGVGISIKDFYLILELSRRTFVEHIERIVKFLDYQSFIEKFPNIDFIEDLSDGNFISVKSRY